MGHDPIPESGFFRTQSYEKDLVSIQSWAGPFEKVLKKVSGLTFSEWHKPGLIPGQTFKAQSWFRLNIYLELSLF